MNSERNIIMKTTNDNYLKITLTIIAVCLMVVIALLVKAPGGVYAESPVVELPKTLSSEDAPVIEWCDVRDTVIKDLNKDDLSSAEYINWRTRFKCPQGYFIIGFTEEFASAGAGRWATIITKIEYAKPCIKSGF
jgi:hypothetical protein